MTTTISDFVFITPALTTVYTTPPGCFSKPYTLDSPDNDSTELVHGLWPDPLCTATEWEGCYPQPRFFSLSCGNSESFSTVPNTVYMGQTFSPGVCPDDQTVIFYSVSTRTNGNKLTVVTCCPSTYTANGDACYKTLTSPTSLLLVTRDPETYHKLVTIGIKTILAEGSNATFIYQPPITVAWEQSDLSLFTPLSAPLKMLETTMTSSKASSEVNSSVNDYAEPTSQSGSSPPQQTSIPSNSVDTPSHLTSKQKRDIGIGFGCMAGLLLLLGIGVAFYLRRSRIKI
ncbi:hypothetical protein BGZ63DRAFT_373031 [Mariannaea sp. PMI_226]|nr:hypothetical protein BGZ63DRAFT_373031 [Mariannaea sp. PMI_226]